jgi:multidrug efflux system membrane fusion protein
MRHDHPVAAVGRALPLRRPVLSRAPLLLLAALALLTLNRCGGAPATSSAGERPPAPVSVAQATTADVPVYLDEVGKAVAREIVSIQPQVSGRITEIHFSDGADVKKGDLLFTIDPRPFQAQLDSAEATLAQAKAALDFARLELARAEGLVVERAIAQEVYDTRRNAVDVAAAQVQQSTAAVETARLSLGYTAIRSPIDGRTGRRLVDVGNVVTADQTPLLSIQRLDPIYTDFTITQDDLTAVQRHMAKGALRVEVRLPDEPNDPVVGDLTFLDNSVEEGTGTVQLRATLPNGRHRLWPGRFVDVRLILATDRGAVLIPATAPQTAAQGVFVYVVKPDSTAELRPVTLGQRQGDLVVVEKGLKGGETVIVEGQMAVIPGAKVRIVEKQGQG